jgi:unsaturated rhamnogalacturonyl hydrolase
MYTMKKREGIFPGLKAGLMLGLGFFVFTQVCFSQVVGLDNWYNRETNAKTGQPFHYLWTDTENSGYSQWGDLFKKHGASLTTVEQAADAENLSKLNVYIIVDPDTTTESKSPNYIEPADIKAIKGWVEKGGVLVLMANDAPNCEFTHLNMLAGEFGIHFNHVSLHPVLNRDWNMGAFTSLPDHPVFKGVAKIYMKEISSFNLKSPAIPVLAEKGIVYMAESKVGKGLVIAIGDPWIYNEYIDHKMLPADFENLKAAENLTNYIVRNSRKGQ